MRFISIADHDGPFRSIRHEFPVSGAEPLDRPEELPIVAYQQLAPVRDAVERWGAWGDVGESATLTGRAVPCS